MTLPDAIPISLYAFYAQVFMFLTVRRTKQTRCIGKPPALAPMAIASLLSSALSRHLLDAHYRTGVTQARHAFANLLRMFTITNAIAALVQMCGAVVLNLTSLTEKSTGVEIRRGVLLVYTQTSFTTLSDDGRSALPHNFYVTSLLA